MPSLSYQARVRSNFSEDKKYSYFVYDIPNERFSISRYARHLWAPCSYVTGWHTVIQLVLAPWFSSWPHRLRLLYCSSAVVAEILSFTLSNTTTVVSYDTCVAFCHRAWWKHLWFKSGWGLWRHLHPPLLVFNAVPSSQSLVMLKGLLFIFILFFSTSLLLASLTRGIFYPQRASGQAAVTGVYPSPPRYVALVFCRA